jgi:putative ABC transport system substrate-binding protein
MGSTQSRRDFLRSCTLSFIATALSGSARGFHRQVLIVILSTGYTDPGFYSSLERELKDSLSDFDVALHLVRREVASTHQPTQVEVDDLLTLQPDILICLDLDAALAASKRRRGQKPPIVFLVHDDPLRYGLIESYAHPGGNLTGVTTFRCVDGKMVEYLAESFPDRKRFGYLLDESEDNTACKESGEAAARSTGTTLLVIDVSSQNFITEMPARLAPLRLDAVVAPASAPLWNNARTVVETLNGLRLPAIYESERFLNEGGLMCYGPVRKNARAQVALNVRKILRGDAAGELPVEQPTLFELVINLRAPHFVNYRIQASSLRRADRLME